MLGVTGIEQEGRVVGNGIATAEQELPKYCGTKKMLLLVSMREMAQLADVAEPLSTEFELLPPTVLRLPLISELQTRSLLGPIVPLK